MYSVIAHGHGYVDLQRLELAEVDGAFRTIRNTPATILDIRGYPSSGARAFVARLGRPGTQPTMIGGTPRYGGAHGSFWVEEEFWTDPEGSGERYEGRLAVLADGSTQSAAEHIGALIRSVAAVTFIGSRTSGADERKRALAETIKRLLPQLLAAAQAEPPRRRPGRPRLGPGRPELVRQWRYLGATDAEARAIVSVLR